jgi:hypothetical protein
MAKGTLGGRHDGDNGDDGTRSVPEPSSFLLLAAGLGGLALLNHGPAFFWHFHNIQFM